jgi:hypothetical protein
MLPRISSISLPMLARCSGVSVPLAAWIVSSLAGDVAGESRQRGIGQRQVGGGAIGVGLVDLRQAVGARQHPHPRGGDRIVGRAGQLLAAAKLRLQRFGLLAQRSDVVGGAIEEGAGAGADRAHGRVT